MCMATTQIALQHMETILTCMMEYTSSINGKKILGFLRSTLKHSNESLAKSSSTNTLCLITITKQWFMSSSHVPFVILFSLYSLQKILLQHSLQQYHFEKHANQMVNNMFFFMFVSASKIQSSPR
jgi:hypothetical protein